MVNPIRVSEICDESFAMVLREIRVKRNLNQTEFGLLIGYEKSNVSRLEQEDVFPRFLPKGIKEVNNILGKVKGSVDEKIRLRRAYACDKLRNANIEEF